jgi:hypothetical protein
MAKKTQTAVETVVKDQAVAEMPADLAEFEGAGTENIGSDDIRPPRLMIAQAGSPQVKKAETKYIEGLKEGDIFNDLSGQNYGDGTEKPLEVVVINMLGARAMELRSMEEGGGIIDNDVPLDDPRCQWTEDEEGNSVKPVATKFYDYLVWLPETQEMLALSMKSTQIKVARDLNSMVKMPLFGKRPPAWARTFLVTTAMEKNEAKQSWAGWRFRLKDGLTPVETRQMCATLYKTFEKKNIVIDREPDMGDAPESATAGEM